MRQDSDSFDANTRWEDRTVLSLERTDFPACALIEILVLSPKSYTHYELVAITGATTDMDINVYSVANSHFEELTLGASTSPVVTGPLRVDSFEATANIGNVEVQSIESISLIFQSRINQLTNASRL